MSQVVARVWRRGIWCSAAFVVLLFAQTNLAQQKPVGFDEKLYGGLKYRNIGPFRGGRSAAVTGVVGQPMTFYFGSTGGGEKTVRGNVSHGYGMWKSTDAGKTWKSIGLKDSRHIPRIRIHPKNPDLVYAAVLGHLFGPNEQRGVYRSKDGGANWERILFVNNDVGAVDLVMDATNPRILFATMWRVRRTPYVLESGGEGSSLWKSIDGGDTWKDISRNEGLPQGTLGIIGVTVSPANPNRVWTIIEAQEGGVFRSDDGGEKWVKLNDERKLRQRAWYYTRIYADPKNADQVYVLNVEFWRSKDGGKTYESIDTPHGDHHDLWIAPEDPSRMIVGDDGGAQVSFSGGSEWSTYHNQPTAQFYRVTTDNTFPYRIYGAQQDNSTIRIYHRSSEGGVVERDWEETAGGESGWIAPDPKNNDIVYGGSYGGYLTRVHHKTGELRDVNVWPDNPMGHGAKDWKYRFQWNFPILFSRHDPNVLYAAGNALFKTTNEGQTWTAMSHDLTRNDTTKLGPSGGPITKDNTSVEYYCTIFTVTESPLKAGVIWTGSDDGLIHLTQDNGKSWQSVTPPLKLMPEWIQINSIEASPFEVGGLYVAATMYKNDDFRPYLYKTSDFGKTWTKITSGIGDEHFTRVIRADPKRRGLLYAGTESGIYISFDDGANWKSFQLNLPIVPITDLTVKENDLVVATQGRSFWVMDDLTVLHQLNEQMATRNYFLYTPRPTYRMPGFSFGEPPKGIGENPPNGVMVHYYFKDAPDSSAVKLRVLDASDKIIKSFSPKAKERGEQMPVKVGMNRFVWNMRYPEAERFENLILWAGGTQGPKAVPGEYQARLIVGKDSTTVPFTILKDPRATSTQEDFIAQFDFLMSIRDKLTETHKAIKQIREVRKQVNDINTRAKTLARADTIKAAARAMLDKMTKVEETLYQTKNQSSQDPLNFPIRLNNKLSALGSAVAYGDFRPTDQAVLIKNELTTVIDAELTKLRALMENDLPAFNKLVRESEVPAVIVETKPAKETGTN